MRVFHFLTLNLLFVSACALAAPDNSAWQQFDRNADGRLSADEVPPLVKSFFGEADTDQDGAITPEEWRIFRDRQLSQRPSAVPAGDRVYADVAYGPHARNKLDLWLPQGDGPFPFLVYFHGGGFVAGDKSRLSGDFRKALLAGGIAVATANYRFSFQAPYPAPMHDGARAIQFLRAHADAYHLDAKHVAASGGSAGAGMSLWLATHDDLADPNSDDPVLRQSSRISAAVVHAAQSLYDPRKSMEIIKFPGIHPLLTRFFDLHGEADLKGPEKIALFKDSSPLYHVTPDDAPAYLFYGVPDTPITENTDMDARIHHPAFGHLMKDAMDKAGVECVLRLRAELSSRDDLYPEEIQFLEKYLKDVK